MDNHPIPQDVTGFQFKLIGNMTIKQFAYVASGVILAVILYYLPLTGFLGILIKVIFIPLFGGSGFLIAFLPVEGRPVDIMAGNFLKALVTPNQYIYKKQGAILSFTTTTSVHANANQLASRLLTQQKTREKSHRLQLLLQNSPAKTTSKLDEKEANFLTSLSSESPTLFSVPFTPQHAPTAATPPSSSTSQVPDLAQQEQTLETELAKARSEEESNQSQEASHSAAHQKVTLLERQIQALHTQRQQLEKKLVHLQTQLTAQNTSMTASLQDTHLAPTITQPKQPVQPPIHALPYMLSQPNVKRADLPSISDTPNVVVGIVKDPRGNVLPSILVEIKDKDGNPVRAFKTNALGQFASATPLTSGSYTIELEDPRGAHQFDVIQIMANNQILYPIEITSHDAREELRKQLFN